ncbi:MAG TPA: tRNA (N6-threonylcarbamoyladenosine(37)-N6)-methyltransferase TrmO [Puia sp.]|jgi:tRNA-Thr(GGU) m(6)t(6)A37 methyltransferase TsaA|nr:tRNA (N6-threonylcarbamoyladenosine(37)-N6)-methyltransferase TrmO [Puia sp.]
MNDFVLEPIGSIKSPLKNLDEAPKQGYESAPEAWIELRKEYAPAMDGIRPGDAIILITWLHRASRNVLKVHPRGEERNPLTGVFATRSPDRPNPLGLHRVNVLAIDGVRIKVGPLEAIDGTPVVDIKPVLSQSQDA